MGAVIVRRLLGGLLCLLGIGLLIGFLMGLQEGPPPSRFRSVFSVGLVAGCLLTGWRWMRWRGKGIHEVVPPNLQCPELEVSVERAKATLPEFIREVERGIDGAFVKFPLSTPQGLIEHIWGYVHFYRDGRFNVTLANDPIDPQQPSEGRRDVPEKEVEDWQIVAPDGSIRGAYSLVALFEYWARLGRPLSPLMKEQKAKLQYFSAASPDTQPPGRAD